MTLAIVLALLAAIGWGTSAVLVRAGLRGMSPVTGTVVSLAAGATLIGTIALAVYGPDAFALSAAAFGWIFLLGSVNYPLGRFLNFTAVSLAGVSRAAPIQAASPLIAMSLGIFLGNETLTPLIALGALSIVSGVVLIVTARAK